jgi:hypothetical protein
MKIFRTFGMIAAIAGMMFMVFSLLPADVAAQATKDAACEGVGLVGGSGCDPGGSTTVPDIIQLVIRILSWIVGVVAVIMIIIGGLKYVTSGGDSASISSAKNTIIYALIGLVIAVLAQVIVTFVLGAI